MSRILRSNKNKGTIDLTEEVVHRFRRRARDLNPVLQIEARKTRKQYREQSDFGEVQIIDPPQDAPPLPEVSALPSEAVASPAPEAEAASSAPEAASSSGMLDPIDYFSEETFAEQRRAMRSRMRTFPKDKVYRDPHIHKCPHCYAPNFYTLDACNQLQCINCGKKFCVKCGQGYSMGESFHAQCGVYWD